MLWAGGWFCSCVFGLFCSLFLGSFLVYPQYTFWLLESFFYFLVKILLFTYKKKWIFKVLVVPSWYHIWKRDSNGRYIVRANVTLLEGVSDKTTWKLLWNNLVPPKVSFFT